MAIHLLRRRTLVHRSLLLPPSIKPGLSLFYHHTRDALAFEEIAIASDGPYDRPRASSTALVLHGLIGSRRNWRSFARNLASRLALASPSHEWRFILVDLRNHGQSAELKGFKPPHDLKNAARDLAYLVESQKWKWPDAVIGHSMGGKVALQFTESCSSGEYGQQAVLPKQVWVLDSVPGEVKTDASAGEVEKVLQTLENLPHSIPSRKWVIDYMLEHGFSKSLSEWIGSNLKKYGDHVTWTFNLQAAIAMFDSYRELSYWPLLEKPPKGLEVEIVQAQNSDRWSPPILERLGHLSSRVRGPEEGKVSLHLLPKAGHWVHVDNPTGLLDIMAPNFISEVGRGSL